MAKKILAIIGAIVIVGIIVLGVTTCGVMKIADDWVKEKEPELRQYVQMTEQEQNAYVEKHMDELFRRIDAYAESHRENSTQEERNKWAKFESDSEAKSAGVQLGRAIVAALVMASEPITNELSSADKEKYQNESEQIEKRTEIYTGFLEKFGLSKK